ncbi:MAG TPA: iron-containing alcohol dehydrogenase [Myxococcota bacterium]|nr:iron-containing alcohol dehydrogenase [Myxococcota bacterium]HRY95006.1 iron-containing alcohol dehydrogenase [Myxococcota bacterium]HSA22833.1 iron-containing alcohol dehydrogenase [Myxococcota bacterium]
MCPGTEPLELPEHLEGLLGLRVACACGRTHEVTLQAAPVGPGVVAELPGLARRAAGAGRRVVVVQDRVTRAVLGERVARLLAADGQRVETCLVPDGAGGRPHADEGALAVVEASLAAADLAVAVGAGTLNDLTKLASHRRGVPYLCVATAPSMNGYTSGLAAMSLGGLKRTVPCVQPFAVVADLDVLGQAPAALVAAGLGDLESKPTATADHRLAAWVRGEHHCPAPERVVLAAEARVAESAAGLPRRDPEAMRRLTEALLLSGLSMKLAGSSSPASGGEHLMSHLWDMEAAAEGRVEGWHGAQVGVATLITASLYERLGRLCPGELDRAWLRSGGLSREAWRERLRAEHGPRAAEVEAEFLPKLRTGVEREAELGRVLDGWDELWGALAPALRPARLTRAVLEAGGAPVTARAVGLTPGHLRRALLVARQIRGRYTVLDLAEELGVLPGAAEEVLAASSTLG